MSASVLTSSPAPATVPPTRRLAWLLARAHLKKRRTQNGLTVAGIAVGVAVLIAALSLTNGFTGALISATLQASPHLSVQPYTPSGQNKAAEQQLRQMDEVAAFTPFVADKALLTRPADEFREAGTDFSTLFGVGSEAADVLELRPEEGELLRSLEGGEILLGAALARNIGAYPGESINLLNSAQQRREMTVKGVFHTGNYLIDSGYAFTNLATLQELQGTGNISGYQIRLHDPEAAPAVGAALASRLPYAATPWQSLYGTLLDQLNLQKQVIGFVVFLIVIVAAFGIANVMTLAVFEKTQEIAILRAIGATQGIITQTFLLEGLILGLSGLVLGNLLGLAVAGYFTWRPFQIPGDLYFITTLPVEVRLSDLLWVNAVGLLTTLLAALIPARRAAAIEPARIIR
ncbi:ABC transporter permease [Deinococcus radiophilus]|uniref:ABC transporter permease n=1 Tax=Deinococcus radiophilus TaxID=32062 RepID=UPI001E4333AA|nr:ABC transporter permease [Deinococcus radiophilus]UFA50827.1 ABC transporter permease [Deinococcus radiophilus]